MIRNITLKCSIYINVSFHSSSSFSESNLNSNIALKEKHSFLDSYLSSNIALKRQQTAGLIPFPRVGRNEGNKFWSSQYPGKLNYKNRLRKETK